jgi:pyruvate/2-oxoglutarate dehydrogenase complex dihydrolipoamide acyltransferase (E2) component
MTSVVIPSLGEAIYQVRIVRWLKAVGDPVTEGEQLVEVSTDKIDAILPAPATGVVLEIGAAPEDYVPIGATVATIG